MKSYFIRSASTCALRSSLTLARLFHYDYGPSRVSLGGDKACNKLARPCSGRAKFAKRLMRMKMKEDKNWNKKVVVPPVNSGLYPPVDRIKIQPDGQSPGRRKALPVEVARSFKTVVPTTLLVFSSPFSRPKGRDRSRLAHFCLPVATTSSSGSGGVPDSNRSGSASVLQHSRARERKSPLPPLPLVLPELIARANTATRSILDRNAGTCERGYTATAPTAPQPQWQSATHAIKENEERRPGTAPKGTKHQPQLRPAAAGRPARPPCGPPTRAASPLRHGCRRRAAARPGAATQERWRALGAALRRQLPREPYPPPTPPCARVPCGQDAQPSAEPADGSQLAPPPPPARGAAAPSSLVVPVISPFIPAARGAPYISPSQNDRSRQKNAIIDPAIRPPLSAVLT